MRQPRLSSEWTAVAGFLPPTEVPRYVEHSVTSPTPKHMKAEFFRQPGAHLDVDKGICHSSLILFSIIWAMVCSKIFLDASKSC